MIEYFLMAAARLRAGGGVLPVFATWDPSTLQTGGALSNSDLTLTTTTGASHTNVQATLGKATGRWYFEVKNDPSVGGSGALVGIADADFGAVSQYIGLGAPGNSAGINWDSGAYNFGFTTGTNNVLTAFGPGDTWCVAVDLDAKKAWIYRNGNPGTGNPSTGANPTYTWSSDWTIYPSMSNYTDYGTKESTANFGATPFEYLIPQGYNPGWTDTYDPRTYAQWDVSGANVYFTNENRTANRYNVSAGATPMRATLPKTSGNWYFEYTLTGSVVSATLNVGLCISTFDVAAGQLGTTAGSVAQTNFNIQAVGFTAGTSQVPEEAIVVTDTFCVAVNCTQKKMWVSKNQTPNVTLAPSATWTHSDPVFPAADISAPLQSTTANFGRTPFLHGPPAGYNQGWYTSP
jgi:hypothetical protein